MSRTDGAAGVTIVQQIAALPELVSQRTALDVLGLSRREFLAAAKDHARDGGTVIARGKLRLVDRLAFVAWMRRTSSTAIASRRTDPVDELERELGIARVA